MNNTTGNDIFNKNPELFTAFKIEIKDKLEISTRQIIPQKQIIRTSKSSGNLNYITTVKR